MNQKGLTLYELLIAVALGSALILIILKSIYFVQKKEALNGVALTSVEGASLALFNMTNSIRKSNIGKRHIPINSETPEAGIVLAATNYNYLYQVDTGNLTRPFIGPTNTTELGSDQLVIQYKAKELGGYDCTNKKISSLTDMIVEKYYISKNNNTLNLVCSSGRFNKISGLSGFDTVNIMMRDVDYFTAILTVQDINDDYMLKSFDSAYSETPSPKYRNISITDYLNSASKYKIVGVQLGLIWHMDFPYEKVMTSSVENKKTNFFIFNKNVEIKPSYIADKRFFVMTQAVSLRNGSGALE